MACRYPLPPRLQIQAGALAMPIPITKGTTVIKAITIPAAITITGGITITTAITRGTTITRFIPTPTIPWGPAPCATAKAERLPGASWLEQEQACPEPATQLKELGPGANRAEQPLR